MGCGACVGLKRNILRNLELTLFFLFQKKVPGGVYLSIGVAVARGWRENARVGGVGESVFGRDSDKIKIAPSLRKLKKSY